MKRILIATDGSTGAGHALEAGLSLATEVGAAYFDEEESARLREYLVKGGFLWADDFWGSYAWEIWESQLRRVREFQSTHTSEAREAIARLKEAAVSDQNVFAVLMDAARVCSLGQITEAFFEVGGQYRRNV